jgi:hypothetical protein
MIEKITYPDGSIEFMETLNGNRYLHNDDGPAVINADGSKKWVVKGHPHREGGPAIISADGTKRWYRNGQLHNDKGPAIVWANGDKEWYVNGEFFGRMRLPKTS